MNTKFRKLYTLKNGYKLSEIEVYDGYQVQKRWGIWKPNGELYMSCSSYSEAYELASHLKELEEC